MPRAILSVIVLAALSGCRNPRDDVALAQAMIDAGAQITMMQQEQSIMQSQLDSLRDVVAWQDTILRRLASHTGLPVASR